MLSLVSVQPAYGGVWDQIKKTFNGKDKEGIPKIKVLIGDRLESAAIEVQGTYNIYDPFKDKRVATRFASKSNMMEPVTDGIRWGEIFPDLYQIKIVPDKKETVIIVNGLQYIGPVYIYNIENRLSVVNEVEVEDYVRSVLSAYFDEPIENEALNAVSIAIRTEASYQVASSGSSFWHVNGQKSGYFGYGVTQKPNNVESSIKATNHLILSSTSPYYGRLTPFPTIASDEEGATGINELRLNIAEAREMAERGDTAADILDYYFPTTTIQVMKTCNDIVMDHFQGEAAVR